MRSVLVFRSEQQEKEHGGAALAMELLTFQIPASFN